MSKHADHMEERDADRRAVARGLRRAYAIDTDLPDRFLTLLHQIGEEEVAADSASAEEMGAARATARAEGQRCES